MAAVLKNFQPDLIIGCYLVICEAGKKKRLLGVEVKGLGFKVLGFRVSGKVNGFGCFLCHKETDRQGQPSDLNIGE